MAVLTQLARRTVNDWLIQFDVGELTDLEEISAGIENSNFFINTLNQSGVQRWVLTLLEQTYSSRELLVPLNRALLESGMPVAAIKTNQQGDSITNCAGKQAILAQCLSGSHPTNPTSSQCAAVGRFLARFHRAALPVRANARLFNRDLNWLQRRADDVRAYLPYKDQALLQQVLAQLKSLFARRDVARLPTGIIHGDLFRDNVLFDERGLSGVLDFHHAGEHYLLFDIAVAANDWCTQTNGELDPERLIALLKAYHQQRTLTTEELWFLPIFMTYGASAFWLSRLTSRYPPPKTLPVALKNPDEFQAIVTERCAHFYYFDHRLLQQA